MTTRQRQKRRPPDRLENVSGMARQLHRSRPNLVALTRHEVQHGPSAIVAAHRRVRFFDEAPNAFAQPVVAARHAGRIVHALLHDTPAAVGQEDKRVLIQLVAVLHRGVVHLGGKAARLHQRRRI
jgi:hypothetical protein